MPITSTRRTPAHFPGLHVVARNNSLCFPPNILDIQASFETETLLRTHHPLLRDLSEVRVYENRHDATDIAWVLLNMDLTVERIGGRRVYCLPQDKFAWYYGQVHSYLEFDPIWHYLEETKPPQPGRHPPSDPRKGFPLASLPYIKAYFPTSVGVRIYVYGVVAILFNVLPSRTTLWQWNVPSTIGGMRYLLLSLSHIPTSPPNSTEKTNWTTELCQNPTGQPIGLCSVGVGVECPAGRQYLTTVTHGFLPSNNLIARAVLGGASLFLTYLPQSFQHAVDVVWAKTERLMGMAMTPVGSRVYTRLSDLRPRLCFGEIVTPLAIPLRVHARPRPHCGRARKVASSDRMGERNSTIERVHDNRGSSRFPRPTAVLCGSSSGRGGTSTTTGTRRDAGRARAIPCRLYSGRRSTVDCRGARVLMGERNGRADVVVEISKRGYVGRQRGPDMSGSPDRYNGIRCVISVVPSAS